jgi:hypothetical protein
MLVCKLSALGVDLESKELGLGKPKLGFGSIKRDVIFQTHCKKLLEILEKLIEIIGITKPIINIVRYFLEPFRCEYELRL